MQQWSLTLPAHHVQGISVSEPNIWISTVDRHGRQGWVFRLDRESLKIVASRDVTLDNQFHPGGIQEVNGAIWVPVAEYRPRSTSTLVRLDATTLETKSSFKFDDHLGAAASDGAGTVFAVNWDAKIFYYFDEAGQLKEQHNNPTGVAYQDIDYSDGMLYACGRADIEGKKVAVIDVLDVKTCELQMRYLLPGEVEGKTVNFAREGFAKFNDGYFVLPDDGPQTTLYRFALPAQ